MCYIEDIEKDIINRLRIKSHSFNTLSRDISYVSKEELVYALNQLIQGNIVAVKKKDITDNQTEDRYYIKTT